MEVEALEKKGHAAFAKAMKSFGSSERYKRSTRLVSAGFCIVFFFFFLRGEGSDGTMLKM